MTGFYYKLKELINNDRGITLVMVAAGMVAFLALTAFVVDLGYLYYERRNMQNAADAAALASAFHLPGNTNGNSIIVNTAEDYAYYHGYHSGNDSNISVSNPNGNIRQVEVVIERDVPLYFARAIGARSSRVATSAVAATDAPGLDVFPFTMLEYDDLRKAIEKDDIGDGGILKPFLDQYKNEDLNNKLMELEEEQTKVFLEFDNGTLKYYKDYGDSYSELKWEIKKEHFCYVVDYLIKIRIAKLDGFDDLDDDFSTWFRVGDVPGNWGLLDLSDFRPGGDHPGDHPVESVLLYGLEESICDLEYIQVEGATIDNKPGQNQNIQEARGALEYRIEKQEGIGWIILVLPAVAEQIKGKERDIHQDDYILAKIEGIDPDRVQDNIVEGYLTDVYCGSGCSDILGSSFVGVYLIR